MQPERLPAAIDATVDSLYPAEFPYRPAFVHVGGYRLSYLEAGRGEETLLLVHGNPAGAYVYGRLMQRLASHFHCVAPDLLGFGLSDKPPRESDYSLSGHIELIAGLVRALDLQRVILVVHDWGGPIGWGAALREPERYIGLVVLNTLTEAPLPIRPHYWLPFHFFRRARRLFAYLVRQHNLFQRLGLAIMTEADRAVFFRANHSPETRAAIAAFPWMIPHNCAHPNYPLLRDILCNVAAWEIPALVLFSDRDSVFTAEQGRQLAGRLQQARFHLLRGPKHFLQYERPEEVGREIVNFIGDTF